ncbi:deoxyuridine 5'-triphosphate nucleotidohydrolase, mitochondrial isoform X2 [Myotis yumanensis]|uniref:deoxyuridine 5'-triphosphate nucleotidohydrolase, mitochondrial isoform X2 n=1 Tax=Myotis yumanensis TaxID=159337 RepID=UPI0038CF6614
MPCSEDTLAVSPSKRPRPAEEGGLRLRFVRLSEHATAPTKGSARAAGYDLHSPCERSWPQLGVLANPPTPAEQMQPSCPHAYDYTIPPMEKTLVKTDIQIALPSGCYGRVAPRSGLAAKHFIDVGAGVIDEDYRGNLGVVLFNFGKEKFEVKKGDRIAQLICERIFYPEIEEVQALDDTERGSGGFGSTGKN